MQTVVIPVDFSDRSRKALDYAVDLFQPEKVRFVLVHAYTRISSNEFLISVDDIIESDIIQKLETEIEYMKRRCNCDNLNVIKVCERSDIISSINNAHSKYAAELLILGTDGELSWNDFTTKGEGKTLNIVQEVATPTLIVPDSSARKPSNILFATLLNGIHNNREIRPLIDMVKECNAHLDIVNVEINKNDVSAVGSELKSTVNGYFTDVDFDIHTILGDDASMAIGKFSEEHKSDMICIIYRKHGLLEKLLKQSVAKKMINHIDRPILALKQPLA